MLCFARLVSSSLPIYMYLYTEKGFCLFVFAFLFHSSKKSSVFVFKKKLYESIPIKLRAINLETMEDKNVEKRNLLEEVEVEEGKGQPKKKVPSQPASSSGAGLGLSVALATMYVSTSVMYLLSIRYQKHIGVTFDGVMVVFTVEAFKLIVSMIAYHVEHGHSMLVPLLMKWKNPAYGHALAVTEIESGKLWRNSIPYAGTSLLYAVYNNLTFFCLKRVDPGTYQVVIQDKILAAGFLFTVFFRKFLTARQWFALTTLMVGVAIKFVVSSEGTTENQEVNFSMIGIIFVAIQGVLSSLAGVYNEFALKGDAKLSIHIQNFFMYFYALFFNVAIALVTTDITSLPVHLLAKPSFLMIAIFGAMTGLSAAFILKFINVIVKAFAAGVEVCMATFAAAYFLNENITSMDVVSAVVVTLSIVLYSTKGAGSGRVVRCGL